MQAAIALSSPSLVSPSLHSSSPPFTAHRIPILTLLHVSTLRRPSLTCFAQEEPDPYVVYDLKKSVFPAEACEELGGDSCEFEGVGPEVKFKTTVVKERTKSSSGDTDREYVEYTEMKTVFPGEACEELGGEFCEPDYQTGVYPEKAASKKAN